MTSSSFGLEQGAACPLDDMASDLEHCRLPLVVHADVGFVAREIRRSMSGLCYNLSFALRGLGGFIFAFCAWRYCFAIRRL